MQGEVLKRGNNPRWAQPDVGGNMLGHADILGVEKDLGVVKLSADKDDPDQAILAIGAGSLKHIKRCSTSNGPRLEKSQTNNARPSQEKLLIEADGPSIW